MLSRILSNFNLLQGSFLFAQLPAQEVTDILLLYTVFKTTQYRVYCCRQVVLPHKKWCLLTGSTSSRFYVLHLLTYIGQHNISENPVQAFGFGFTQGLFSLEVH